MGKFEANADECTFLGYSLEFKASRVYLIDHQKVIESMNVTFDDTKLLSLQREIESESLEFENLPDYYFGDEDAHVVVSVAGSSNAHVETYPSRGSVGNNTQSQTPNQSSAESTNQCGRSLSHNSNNSRGANESGSTSRTYHNFEQGESSRSNLPRQMVWNRDHPFHLIIGDPDTGVRTRRATHNECNYSGFLSKIKPKKVEDALIDPDWVIAMQDELNQFERQNI